MSMVKLNSCKLLRFGCLAALATSRWPISIKIGSVNAATSSSQTTTAKQIGIQSQPPPLHSISSVSHPSYAQGKELATPQLQLYLMPSHTIPRGAIPVVQPGSALQQGVSDASESGGGVAGKFVRDVNNNLYFVLESGGSRVVEIPSNVRGSGMLSAIGGGREFISNAIIGRNNGNENSDNSTPHGGSETSHNRGGDHDNDGSDKDDHFPPLLGDRPVLKLLSISGASTLMVIAGIVTRRKRQRKMNQLAKTAAAYGKQSSTFFKGLDTSEEDYSFRRHDAQQQQAGSGYDTFSNLGYGGLSWNEQLEKFDV